MNIVLDLLFELTVCYIILIHLLCWVIYRRRGHGDTTKQRTIDNRAY